MTCMTPVYESDRLNPTASIVIEDEGRKRNVQAAIPNWNQIDAIGPRPLIISDDLIKKLASDLIKLHYVYNSKENKNISNK